MIRPLKVRAKRTLRPGPKTCSGYPSGILMIFPVILKMELLYQKKRVFSSMSGKKYREYLVVFPTYCTREVYAQRDLATDLHVWTALNEA